MQCNATKLNQIESKLTESTVRGKDKYCLLKLLIHLYVCVFMLMYSHIMCMALSHFAKCISYYELYSHKSAYAPECSV